MALSPGLLGVGRNIKSKDARSDVAPVTKLYGDEVCIRRQFDHRPPTVARTRDPRVGIRCAIGLSVGDDLVEAIANSGNVSEQSGDVGNDVGAARILGKSDGEWRIFSGRHRTAHQADALSVLDGLREP